MANASADKLKALGLRHGEKVVMGLAVALCLVFVGMALSHPTIETTPEQVRKAADQAESNLNAHQKPEDILKKLEDSGIKNPDFEKAVDAKLKDKLVFADYTVRSPWITLEPGAGLIRDMPELIAPTEVVAYPGRGSTLVFQLDENGERILDTTKKVADIPKNKRRKKKRRGGGRAPGMMAMAGAPKKKKKGKSAAEIEKAELAKYQEKVKHLQGALVGKKEEAKPDEADDEGTEQQGPWKELTKGVRWVALTGVLDYDKLRENYIQALKNPAIAYPNFKQLEIERQVRDSDSEWSDWEPVDMEQNWAIVNHLPEEEEELTPEDVRLQALVDPLPFLKSGYWEKVHVASLVLKEKLEVAKPQPVGGEGMMPGMPGMSGASMPAGAMPGMMPRMGGNEGMMTPGMGMPGMMPGMGMGGMGTAETINFEKTEAKTVMIRQLDFTAEPDKSYRYRLRIVVFNPNLGHEDVRPGVDTTSKELKGPWSEPTEEVTMPADIATYAMQKVQSGNPRDEKVHFEVAKWNPDDGITVVKFFDAGPGEIVGDVGVAAIPGIDGKKKESKKLDFTSRRVVLDAMGGQKRVPQGVGPGIIEIPAVSLLLLGDGSLVVHNQASDVQDEVRKNMDANYKRELEESGKERESSMGNYYGASMMPGAPRGR